MISPLILCGLQQQNVDVTIKIDLHVGQHTTVTVSGTEFSNKTCLLLYQVGKTPKERLCQKVCITTNICCCIH